MTPPRDATQSTRDQSCAFATPDALPVLPLRETVVFPLTIAPVSIDHDRSRKLLDDATRGDRLVALVAIRESESRLPRPQDLYAFATAAIVHDALRGPDNALRVAVQGLQRVRIVGWVQTEPYLIARVHWLPDAVQQSVELDALVLSARRAFLRFVSLVAEPSSDLASTVDRVTDPRQLVYLLASTAPMSTEARQQILEQPCVLAKLRRLIDHLQHEVAVRELMHRIANETTGDVFSRTPPAPVRRRAAEPRIELAEPESEATEARALRGAINRLPIAGEARKEIERELDRLERTPAASPEHGLIRTYLDWVLKMPWGKVAGRPIDVVHARAVLDADHDELTRVKDRIIEYLAVKRLRAERGLDATVAGASREPILCLVGPPGVGKTSLGQSIAKALGRKFVRLALGGIHDEAEIRGHRRTYIGAMPGRILQGLSRCEAADAVFMLDEVDKLGVGFHGDPSAALLEVLDPAQNHAFVDSYLGVPFDLSRVLLLCTANTVDTIPAPLLDRMELLAVAGYTDREKLSIAQRHLIPKAISAHGLRPDEVSFDDAAVRQIVRGYTREAGVRNLGRELAGVLRKVARTVTEGASHGPVRVRAESVRDYLGTPHHYDEVAERIDRPGVATGLAWMQGGGDILFVEASIVEGGEDRLVLTGMMGNVMRESAQAALSYLRSNSEKLGLRPGALDRKTVHVHVPAGSIPKDGPSAGVTIATAIASHALGRVARGDVAMTGEITLRGRVLPVGGIQEKVLAAHRAGLRFVILPRRTEPQLEGVPDDVKDALRFVFVDSVDEVLTEALGLDVER
ncbi:MAG: endopeptidase La [Polyangiaceae bacterium]